MEGQGAAKELNAFKKGERVNLGATAKSEA
jgi:hypothetical protein